MPNASIRHIEPLLPGGDAGVARLSLIPTAVEQGFIGSFGTENFRFTPSAIELIMRDEGTEDFKLKPTGTDIQDIHDLNTGFLDLQPNGVEGPQYALIEATTEYLDLQPAGVELQARQFTDTATERIAFTVTSHDCYAIGTPEYEIEIFKRWNMGSPFARWEVTSLDKRWNAYLVDTGFEIPC